MWRDPIVEEVRQLREAYAEEFNFDLWAIHRDLKEQEKASGRKIVSFGAKRKRPVQPAMALEGEPTTSASVASNPAAVQNDGG